MYNYIVHGDFFVVGEFHEVLKEYFMDLYLLAELKTVALKITTVDMLKPPPDFRWTIYNIQSTIFQNL